jgi:uncharacterized lipoprotein YddW (UPF0748 family)
MTFGSSFFPLFATLAISSAAAAAASTLEGTMYSSDEQAQKGWRPMNGSLPALASMRDGVPTLEFRCNFAGTTLERGSWDHAVNLDLSDARGVQFEVFCPDSSPVSYFSLYFQTQGGWYHLSWFPEKDGEWQTITVNRDEMAPEGSPAGWSKLTTIRISAWRGGERDARFLIRGLRPIGRLGVDASVAVLRGAGSASEVTRFTDRLSGDLRASGIECAELADATDTLTKGLREARLVVLPPGAVLHDGATEALLGYLQAGGKVLAFERRLPERIRASLNLAAAPLPPVMAPETQVEIRFREGALPGAPGESIGSAKYLHGEKPETGKTWQLAEWRDARGKTIGAAPVLASTNCILVCADMGSEPALRREALVAMAGWLVPDLWRESIAAQEKEMAEIGGFKSLAQLTNHIVKIARQNGREMTMLGGALERKAHAELSLKVGNYPEAMKHTKSAAAGLLEAFCMAQQPKVPEFRGFWCHSAFGVKGRTWDEAISNLSSNGFTAIVPNMLWGGAAYYDSKVLPPAKDYTGGDQIAECLAACRRHGLEMHVWKVNWYLGSPARADFADRMKKEGRLQVSFSGEPHNWLCPSHPENQKLEIASMVEVARSYAVDGIHFDYIRYPGSDHCFCERCKSVFEQECGVKAAKWPSDVRTDGTLQAKWNEWRRGNITKVVKAVSEQARAARPKIKISAAVFRDWDKDRHSVAQDWKLWCDKGYVDFVCPMDYTPSVRNFENSVIKQIAWAGKVPCYPGLGVSASRSKFGPDRAIEEILVTRKNNTGGFMIFNYGQREADELVPLLGLGITARK